MRRITKNPPNCFVGPVLGETKKNVIAKVQLISEITPSFAFTEFDSYKDYEESFQKSELGRFRALLPLREMAIRFGLIDSVPHRKVGRKSYFGPEGKVALMFLKSYTGLSAPKLMEQLNANIHYQIFCGIRISPANPVHLLRHTHGQCSTTGKENCESGTSSGCITTFSIILHTRDNYALT